MDEIPVANNDELVIKEFKFGYFLFSSVFLVLLGIVVFGIKQMAFTEKIPIIIVFGSITVLSFRNGLRDSEVLRIDCNGIYYMRRLLTDWSNFLEASVELQEHTDHKGRITYQSMLLLRYFKPAIAGNFKINIPFADLHQQSEAAIIEMIRHCYELSQGKIISIKERLRLGIGE